MRTKRTAFAWVVIALIAIAGLRCHHCRRLEINPSVLTRLEKVEKSYGKRLHIISGYRCSSHNKRVGGAKHSLHMDGKAVDIGFRGASDKARLISSLKNAGFVRIFKYPRWIHADLGRPCDYVD